MYTKVNKKGIQNAMYRDKGEGENKRIDVLNINMG